MKTSTALEVAAIAAVVVALQAATLLSAVAEPVGMAVYTAELSDALRRAGPQRPQLREIIEVRGTRHAHAG